MPELTVDRVDVGAKVNGVEVDVWTKIDVGTVWTVSVSVPVGAIDTGAREEDDVEEGTSDGVSNGVMLTGVIVNAKLLTDVAVRIAEVIVGDAVIPVAVSLVIGAGTTAVVLLDCAIEDEDTAGTAVVSRAEVVEDATSLVTVPTVCEAVVIAEAAVVDKAGTVAVVLLDDVRLVTELASVEVVASEARTALDVTAGLGDTAVTGTELLVSELVTAASVPEIVDELVAEKEDETIAVGSVDTAVESVTDDAGAAELEADELLATTIVEPVVEDADRTELETNELVEVTSVERGAKLSVDDTVETASVADELELTSVERTLLVWAVIMDEETTVIVPVEEPVAVALGSDVAVMVVSELDVAEGKMVISVLVESAEVALAMMLDSTEATDEMTSVAEAEDRVESTLDSTESIDDKIDVTSVG